MTLVYSRRDVERPYANQSHSSFPILPRREPADCHVARLNGMPPKIFYHFVGTNIKRFNDVDDLIFRRIFAYYLFKSINRKYFDGIRMSDIIVIDVTLNDEG